VVVGVSGGPDSLCLLHILLRLREEYRLRLHVAHLHHGARGAEADADADFVAALAAEWNLPATIEKQDVPALAHAHKLAFEETARRVRYTFLTRVAGEMGAHKIAVGHNADDQAETVLMHFLRGAGPAGLRGMLPLTPIKDYRLLTPFLHLTPNQPTNQLTIQPTNQPTNQLTNQLTTPTLIRPLLEVPRAAIEAYCANHGLTPRFDRSNLDTTYFRNRLRHELLPLLATYNPNIRARLCHTATIIATDYELLTQLREQAWAEVMREERETAIVFDRVTWRTLPVALQRATLRQAAYRLRRSLRDVDFVHVEIARQVGLRGETGAQATLPWPTTRRTAAMERRTAACAGARHDSIAAVGVGVAGRGAGGMGRGTDSRKSRPLDSLLRRGHARRPAGAASPPPGGPFPAPGNGRAQRQIERVYD
jgi:tRNA(Ile)-lysidine synthetase-like protein